MRGFHEIVVPLPEGLSSGHSIEERPLVCPSFREADDVHISEGRCLFTLAPLYALLRLEFDLVNGYLEDVGEDLSALVSFFYHRKVLNGIKGWENVLQSLPEAIYRDFEKYLVGCIFARKETNQYATVATTGLFRMTMDKMEEVGVVVFHPSTNMYRCSVSLDGAGAITVSKAPPNPEVVAEAEAFFKTR